MAFDTLIAQWCVEKRSPIDFGLVGDLEYLCSSNSCVFSPLVPTAIEKEISQGPQSIAKVIVRTDCSMADARTD